MMREIREVARSTFLQYVFWYYVLARYVTRTKSLQATQLIDERTTAFLIDLWRFQHHFIEPVSVNGVPRQIGGYRMIDPMLWFERATTSSLVNSSDGRSHDLFYGPGEAPAKPFWRHITNLLRHPEGRKMLEQWEKNDRLPLDEPGLLPSGFLKQVGEHKIGQGSRSPVGLIPQQLLLRYEGLVVNAVDDARVYIGLVREPIDRADEIVSWNNEQRAKALHLEPVGAVRRTTLVDREPLLHFLDDKNLLHELLNWVGSDLTTVSRVIVELGDALGFLARGRPTDPVKADESLDHAKDSMFKWRSVDPHFAQRYTRAAEAELLTFGLPDDRLTQRLSERFGRGLFVFRRYFRPQRFGGAGIDLARKERLGRSCKQVYMEAVNDPGLPCVELTARTATGLLGFRAGTRCSDLSLDILATDCRVEAARVLSRHIDDHPELYGRGNAFPYAQQAAFAIRALGGACGARLQKTLVKAAKADAAQIAAMLADEKQVPFVSARPDDVWIMPDGRYQFCASENVFGTLVAPHHLVATAWCSPLIDMPASARLERMTGGSLIAALIEVLLLHAIEVTNPRLSLAEYLRLVQLLRETAARFAPTFTFAKIVAQLEDRAFVEGREF